MPYFVYKGVNIPSLFLLLVMNNIAVEERNKLQNLLNFLRVVTKYGERSEKQLLLRDCFQTVSCY